MSNDRFVSTGIVPTQAAPDQSSPVHNTPPVSTGDALTGEGSAQQAIQAAADRVRLAEGDIIKARYRVVRHIAGGGMGDVYEVFDNVSREPRAVKLMKSHLLNSPQARERFIKESKAQDLRHPHIVKTIDIDDWPERNVLFITMELVSGQTLRQWFHEAAQAKRHPAFSVSDALEICRQVCAALVYAHRVTIHRDIKPENILLDRAADGRWHVRIADFGITKLLEVTDFTATNQVFGTFQYMAPEQHRDAASVDHRADIYSVGVVLYELLTGQLPQGRFKLPSECGGSIPREADTLITRALAGDRNDRYADMAMMQADIERVLQAVTGAATARTPSDIPVQLPSSVDLGKIVIELQERRMPQVAVVGLSPVPDDILRLRARIEDLDQAIRDLEQEIHPVLRPHQEALAQITSQYNSTLADLKDHPLFSDAILRSRLEQLISDNGAVDTTGLKKASGRHEISQVLALVARIGNVKVATKSRESSYEQFRDAKEKEVARLRQLRRETYLLLNDQCVNDLSGILSLVEPHVDPFSRISLPLATWAELAKRLNEQRRYHWNQWTIFKRAESIWSQLLTARAWNSAKAKQSVAVWRQFLSAFPDSHLADAAKLQASLAETAASLTMPLERWDETELSRLALYIRDGKGCHISEATKRYGAIVATLIVKRCGDPHWFEQWARNLATFGEVMSNIALFCFFLPTAFFVFDSIFSFLPGKRSTQKPLFNLEGGVLFSLASFFLYFAFIAFNVHFENCANRRKDACAERDRLMKAFPTS